ncbi:peptidyl-prolyl cis-trans isomerase cwc27-like protein, partial [Chrysochromulina tobinii]
MSSLTVYANEPVTRGKVVVHTSIGPLDIELWPKEAPMACRNFVQLCLEGYYDGCIFHRVIRDFMAQTGDPTGTGKGGESVFGSKFKDEFHSRLRFTHRGLIAMASEGPDTNGSQFFVTLDRCEWLDRKHTIFGKVTGNSLYNLHRFNELEVDAADRPEFAPRIERCEVLLEPFDDIEAAGEAEAAGQPRALLSSHDVLDDPRLSKKSAIEPSADVPDTAPRPAGGASDAQDARAADAATDEAAAEAAFEARMLEQMHAKRQ